MNIAVNDILLHYNKIGYGHPLILLHGNGEDYHIFDKLVDKLKQHFTIYAIDSRNHGQSSKTNDYSYETMAGDLLQLITRLDLREPYVIGFSDGAIISLLLALDDDNLFNKMVLLGVNLSPADFKEKYYNYLLEEYNKNNDPLIKLMLEQPNIELESLQNIYTPTLVVAGEDDLFDQRVFENIASTLPNSKLCILEGHQHDTYVDGQEILYPILIDFLQ